MGYLQEKYTRTYFLGGKSRSGHAFGVEGYEYFRRGEIAPRYRTFARLFDLSRKSVLDIGCGRGEMLKLCALAGCHRVVGIDFSKDAAEIALEFTQDIPNIEIHKSEATQLPWEAEFDVVFMLDVIEHVPAVEMQRIYPLVFRALKETGFLVINTPIYRSPKDIDETDYIEEVLAMHCNRQTKSKLMRDLARWNFKHIVGLKVWRKQNAPDPWAAWKVKIKYGADPDRWRAISVRWATRFRHPIRSVRNFRKRFSQG